MSSSCLLARIFKPAKPNSTSNIAPIISDESSYSDLESCANFLGSEVASSSPFIAAPLLSASKYWPKTRKLAESESSTIQSDLKLT